MEYTTLNKIRAHSPCHDGWEGLLKSLGKTKADNEPLSFAYILNSLPLDDALWCLRTVDDERKVRLFAADCAERVLHIFESERPNDDRPRLAIKAAREFVNGKIDAAAMTAAWWEARVAAENTDMLAARDAATAAAAPAFRNAISYAYAYAFAGGAWDHASNAVWYANGSAAETVEREQQKKLFKKYFCGDEA